MIRENATNAMRCAMARESAHVLKLVKCSAIALAALVVAGIVTLMFLARGTGEDITGIVAPALLITIVSSVVAISAAVMQRREPKAGDVRPNDDRTG
jgi:succinate dehydrogenase hydrophobic anchor subunit